MLHYYTLKMKDRKRNYKTNYDLITASKYKTPRINLPKEAKDSYSENYDADERN